MSGFWFLVSYIEFHMFQVPYFGYCNPGFRFHVSGCRLPGSYSEFRLSQLGFRALLFTCQISDFRFPISYFQFAASHYAFLLTAFGAWSRWFRFQICDFGILISHYNCRFRKCLGNRASWSLISCCRIYCSFLISDFLLQSFWFLISCGLRKSPISDIQLSILHHPIRSSQARGTRPLHFWFLFPVTFLQKTL